MAKYQHGRGKQSFRDFSKSLREEVRDTVQSIIDGEGITANDVHRFLTRLVNEYIQQLRAEELDVSMWGDRATDRAYDAAEEIIAEYALNEEGEPEEVDEPQAINEEFNPDDTIADGTLFGFELMTKDNKNYVRSKGKPRKRFFDTLDDLQEYVQKVPYILAIQIVKQSDGREIYRVWVEAAKDKKKKPKSAS